MSFVKSVAAVAATALFGATANANVTLFDYFSADVGPVPGAVAEVVGFSDFVPQFGAQGVVQDGVDISMFGLDLHDVNSGTEGDILRLDFVNGTDTFCGFWSCEGDGLESAFLYTLPLDGEEIVNVRVISSFYDDFGVDWLGNQLVFFYDEKELPVGTYNLFTLDIDYRPIADQVPVPAAALLFAPAVLLAARRRRAAA